MATNEFLTVAEVADQLKMNQQTIRNWIDRGELRAVRLGPRRIRVRPADLEQFIAESSAAAKPSEESARQALAEALEECTSASGSADEAASLRQLSRAATALARVVSR